MSWWYTDPQDGLPKYGVSQYGYYGYGDTLDEAKEDLRYHMQEDGLV